MKPACSSYKMECMKNHCPLLGQLRSPQFLVTGEQRPMTSGAGQSKIMDVSVLALVQAYRLTLQVQHGRWKESVFQSSNNGPGFSSPLLLPGSRKLLLTQSQCALVNMSHKTRIITLSFTLPLLLAHSANHLLSVIVLPTSAPTEWGNSVIPTDRLSYGATRNSTPAIKLLCFHHKQILHLH